MKRTTCLYALAPICLVLASINASSQNSQSYLNDVGSTAYGINVPVENGFINVSNGDLHLEFPIASSPQRGALSLNERLVYDSRIWMFSPFGTNGSYHWWPYNVPGSSTSSGGWRFVKGNETGTISYIQKSSQSNACGRDGSLQRTSSTSQILWTDANGTLHPFNASLVTNQNDCTGVITQHVYSGTAADGSGYSAFNDGTGNPLIKDNNGTKVYPQITDRYGNYWSTGSGDLVDDTGRTPVIITPSAGGNANVTWYDVLAPNGPISNNGTRVRYIVTSASVPVATNFQQSDVYEWSPTVQYLTPVQSIQLPNGSWYTFAYDSYGGLSTVTLPTGGIVHYVYSNFVDSSNTANRWLSSRSLGNNPAMTFTPSVVTTCANYSTGCVESVNLHKPSGDEAVYQLTLINGAWNTGQTTYTGSAVSGQKLVNTTSVNTYTNGCSNALTCSGSNYISQSTATTVVYANGSPSASTQTQMLYNASVGKISANKEWDYGSNFSGTPTRETDYAYTGMDTSLVSVYDSTGNPAGQTAYGYTTTATATSGVTQHGAQNDFGPYLQTVAHWLNSTGGRLTMTYGMDDTGQVISTTDPGATSSSTVSYQCANSLPYQTTNALSQATRYGYDCNSGAITSVQDPNDLAASRSGTTYAYEGSGRLQTVRSADGGQTGYGYPSAAEVDTTVIASPSPSIVSQDIVDTFGRKYQHVQGGVSSETTYDANGRVSCTSNPHLTGSSTDGSTCITAYDGLDRPLTQQQPDGNTLQWTYTGAMTTSSDEAGKQWQRTSNVFGQLVKVVEPGSLPTTYTYDGLGNLQTVSQGGIPGGDTPRVRTFIHDSLSRLTNECHPESIPAGQHCSGSGPWSTSIGYDVRGNAQTQTDARGLTATSTYDAMGNGVYTHTPYNNRQQICQTWVANSQALIDKHIYYGGSTIYCGSTPGNNGTITQVKDWRNPNHTQGFSYDGLNRLASLSNADGSMQQSYSTDAFGNFLQTGTANFQVGPNDKNQIGDGSFGYDQAGNLISSNLGIGQASYQYDAAGRMFDVNAGAAYYTYDAVGNRMRKDTGNGFTEYQYLNGQPIAEKISDGTWSDYIYANGQKIARADSFDNYIHLHGTMAGTGNAASWYLPYSGYTIRTGDSISWRQLQTGGARGGIGISFSDGTSSNWATNDTQGQIMNSDTRSGSWYNRTVDLSSFANKRVAALWVDADAQTPAGTWDSFFANIVVYSTDGTVQPVYTGQLAVGLSYFGTAGASNQLGGVGRITNVSNPTWAPGDTVYYHGDQIGSARLLTSEGGWPLFAQTYYPFGQQASNTTSSNHYQYAGLERDAETGLDHATFRQYSSTMGRWMSPDPYDGSMDLGNPQSLHRYNYVGNNPLGFTDPTGLDGDQPSPPDQGCFFCGILGAIFGGGSPPFTGTTQPRPNSQIWDEYHIHYGPDIAGALGLPSGGCEFGACGFQQGASATLPLTFCQQNPGFCSAVWTAIGSIPRAMPMIALATATIGLQGDNSGCIPSAGTQCYDEQSGHSHGGFDPHFHIYTMNQNPLTRQCFWNKGRLNDGAVGIQPLGMYSCSVYPTWVP